MVAAGEGGRREYLDEVTEVLCYRGMLLPPIYKEEVLYRWRAVRSSERASETSDVSPIVSCAPSRSRFWSFWSVGTYPTEPSSTCSARDGGGRRQKQRVCRPVELQGTASQVD